MDMEREGEGCVVSRVVEDRAGGKPSQVSSGCCWSLAWGGYVTMEVCVYCTRIHTNGWMLYFVALSDVSTAGQATKNPSIPSPLKVPAEECCNR